MAVAAPMQGIEVKGAFLRAYALALRKEGLYDQVLDRVSAQARDALVRPPPTSAWVDYALCLEVLRAVQALRGTAGVRRFGYDSVSAGVAPFMQTLLHGLLRIFGVSPATILGNMGRLAGQMTRGADYRWSPQSDTSGVLTMIVPGQRDVDPVVWHSSAGGFEIAFESCGVRGTVQDPKVVADGLGNAADFRVTWRRRG
jgi:hypothetical protein